MTNPKIALHPLGKKSANSPSYEATFEGELLGIFIYLKTIDRYYFKPCPNYIGGWTEPILLAILEQMKEFNKNES